MLVPPVSSRSVISLSLCLSIFLSPSHKYIHTRRQTDLKDGLIIGDALGLELCGLAVVLTDKESVKRLKDRVLIASDVSREETVRIWACRNYRIKFN